MPQQVPIQSLASQEFTITLDGNLFKIGLRETSGVVSVSMSINGVDTLDNVRVVAGTPVIPSRYQEAGNFLFLTQNQQLPDYTQFNISQIFLYFTAAEVAAYRVAPVAAVPADPTVTAEFFNPLGSLPLRFAPQGYTLVT